MLSQLRARFYRAGADRGFTLIELLIVVLIVGILAAVGVPLYLGYVKDAKSAEGKSQAGALWTAIQTTALSKCNSATSPSDGYSKAGFLTSGTTADSRWSIGGSPGSLTISCTDGSISASTPIFQLDGLASDVSGISIRLQYTAGGTPPSQLFCDLTGTGTYSPC